MKLSILKGLSFGLTSGIITTLGLIVGLDSTTHNKLVVLGGILTIAIADAMSDALGMHVSQESENKHSTLAVWESTVVTFFTKFFFALSFAVPILLFPLATAVIISVVYGLLLIASFSYYLAKKNKEPAAKVILEHVGIAIVVVIITHYVGHAVAFLT
ncbi:MAG: VIT1/CCC1 transporter family protein [Nanoarchaeota archaeon]